MATTEVETEEGETVRRGPIRRVVSVLGWVMIGVGLTLVLFVGYTLWGTRATTIRAQSHMRPQFAARVGTFQGAVPPTATPEATRAAADIATNADSAKNGIPVARIRIPRIGVNDIVVSGVTKVDLTRGPGWLTSTSYPGTPGNSLIAAHRTTYGAQFHRLDEVQLGDIIEIDTVAGVSQYKVNDIFLVQADDAEAARRVTRQYPGTRLSLSTCNPKFSAKQRLIVVSELISGPYFGVPSPVA